MPEVRSESHSDQSIGRSTEKAIASTQMLDAFDKWEKSTNSDEQGQINPGVSKQETSLTLQGDCGAGGASEAEQENNGDTGTGGEANTDPQEKIIGISEMSIAKSIELPKITIPPSSTLLDTDAALNEQIAIPDNLSVTLEGSEVRTEVSHHPDALVIEQILAQAQPDSSGPHQDEKAWDRSLKEPLLANPDAIKIYESLRAQSPDIFPSVQYKVDLSKIPLQNARLYDAHGGDITGWFAFVGKETHALVFETETLVIVGHQFEEGNYLGVISESGLSATNGEVGVSLTAGIESVYLTGKSRWQTDNLLFGNAQIGSIGVGIAVPVKPEGSDEISVYIYYELNSYIIGGGITLNRR